MAVPISSPSAEKAVAPSKVTAMTAPRSVTVNPAILPMMSRAIGSTNAAATSPCRTPATTFSNAIKRADAGASNRSSISFVNPKSWTMGSATDWMLENARLMARIPGRSAVP